MLNHINSCVLCVCLLFNFRLFTVIDLSPGVLSAQHRPLPCCSCGKCTCGVNDKIATFQHQDSLMQFLNGLNDSYSQVRTQILMMEPSPSTDKEFSLEIQEERQRCLGFTVAL